MIEKIKKLLNEHPAEVGETYSEHMVQALSVVIKLIIVVMCQLVHAFLPFCDPPFKTDIRSTILFLERKNPESRKSMKAKPRVQ